MVISSGWQTRVVTTSDTTLLLGGRIHTPNSPDATAMAITNDTIVWVGQDQPARTLHPEANIVPLNGAFVTPAFVDAHVHATATGLHLTGLDLSGIRNAHELLSAVATAVATMPGQVLLAHGWDESTWTSPRLPSRQELDEAAGQTPVYLSRVDVHSALVSSALVALAPQSQQVDGWSDEGPVTRDAHHQLRAAARAAITESQRDHAQRTFLRQAAASGIATVHECAGPDISGEDDLHALLHVAVEPGFPRLVAYWGEHRGVDTARRLGVRGLAGDLFVDGALGSATAALHEPYVDHPGSSGTRYLDADSIAEHIRVCTEEGLQAGFHVIGDAAASEVVEGFRQAAATVGHRRLAAARHRLEHLEMVSLDQARALAQWAVTASMQPMFDAAWGGPDGMYTTRLGPDRASTLNPFAMLAAEGVPLAFGSDTPVTPLNPWAAVRAATSHHTVESRISARAAFNAHTRGGHRAAGIHDGTTGTLVPGAVADYAVWDAPPLVQAAPDTRVQRWSTDPRSQVPGLPPLGQDSELPRCLRTVRAGEIIYDCFTQR